MEHYRYHRPQSGRHRRSLGQTRFFHEFFRRQRQDHGRSNASFHAHTLRCQETGHVDQTAADVAT